MNRWRTWSLPAVGLVIIATWFTVRTLAGAYGWGGMGAATAIVVIFVVALGLIILGIVTFAAAQGRRTLKVSRLLNDEAVASAWHIYGDVDFRVGVNRLLGRSINISVPKFLVLVVNKDSLELVAADSIPILVIPAAWIRTSRLGAANSSSGTGRARVQIELEASDTTVILQFDVMRTHGLTMLPLDAAGARKLVQAVDNLRQNVG